MILTLHRDTPTIHCIMGILEVAGRKFHTIEPPWIQDQNGGLGGSPFRSCIPVGVYRLEPRETEGRGKHWIVSNPALDVWKEPAELPAEKATSGRSLVLIQIGNYVTCITNGIAIGKTRERVAGNWRVTHSKDAMNELRQVLIGKYDLSLHIEGCNDATSERLSR